MKGEIVRRKKNGKKTGRIGMNERTKYGTTDIWKYRSNKGTKKVFRKKKQ